MRWPDLMLLDVEITIKTQVPSLPSYAHSPISIMLLTSQETMK